KGRRLHDHAVDAVAALRRLLLDEGALHWVRPLRRAEAFERDYLLLCGDLRQRRDARAHGLAVDMHGAGAALTKPAAEARAMQREIVAERVEQRHVGIIDGDRDRLAVDVERFALRHVCPPGTEPSLRLVLFDRGYQHRAQRAICLSVAALRRPPRAR